MPSKFQTTVEMVAHTAKDITSHPETFMSFLETAANNYKYSLSLHKSRVLLPVPKLRCGTSSVGM